MKKQSLAILSVTHIGAILLGFALGIYTLPILIAPPSPTDSEISAMAAQSVYTAKFVKDLEDSDGLHWGEGEVSIAPKFVAFKGELAPGPDYKLYLSPTFIETEAAFMQAKSSMIQLGDVKTFDNFVVEVKPEVKIEDFNTVIVWCESFGQFITAAKYR